jgi:hypothetical protein
MGSTVWQRKDNWVGAEVDDTFVMIDFESGTYVSLNKTATDIWNALEQPRSSDDIVEALTARYDVSADQCAKAVDRVLKELQEMRLIGSAG